MYISEKGRIFGESSKGVQKVNVKYADIIVLPTYPLC